MTKKEKSMEDQLNEDKALEAAEAQAEAEAEKEKAKNKRRQAEGIQALKDKNNGRGIGRPKTKVNKDFKVQYKLWKSGKQTAVQTFNNLGLTKATFYRLVKEYEQENNN